MHRPAALLALACSSSVALAQVEHIDALLMIDPDGRFVTGLVDFEAQEPLATSTRVYPGAFDLIPIGGGVVAATTDVPGFNALLPANPSIPAGFSTLPPSTDVSFTGKAFEIDGVTANLWHWDGQGAVAFAPAAIVANISKAPDFLFSTDLAGGDEDVPGFVIDRSNSLGGLHKHVDFTVDNAQLAPTGVYVWSFTLDMPALRTEPIYFVHTLGTVDPDQHQAAIDFVQDTLVDEVITLCSADLDGNASVDLDDFGIFASQFGNGALGCVNSCTADLDGDADVDLDDFSIFASQFGNGPAACGG